LRVEGWRVEGWALRVDAPGAATLSSGWGRGMEDGGFLVEGVSERARESKRERERGREGERERGREGQQERDNRLRAAPISSEKDRDAPPLEIVHRHLCWRGFLRGHSPQS